jgi:hypothetical protein
VDKKKGQRSGQEERTNKWTKRRDKEVDKKKRPRNRQNWCIDSQTL